MKCLALGLAYSKHSINVSYYHISSTEFLLNYCPVLCKFPKDTMESSRPVLTGTVAAFLCFMVEEFLLQTLVQRNHYTKMHLYEVENLATGMKDIVKIWE